MERQMGLNEDILRNMTIRVDALEEGPSAMMQSRGRDGDRRDPGDRGDRGGDRGDRGDRRDRGGDRGARGGYRGDRKSAAEGKRASLRVAPGGPPPTQQT